MALIKQKQSGWTFFESVHFRIFIASFALFIALSFGLTALILGNEERVLSQQQREATARYANFLADEVAFTKVGNLDISSWLQEEIHDLKRYRILILDDESRIVEDSSEELLGQMMVDDEILSALSGASLAQEEDNIYRVAVPIWGDGEEVNGVVYVFADLTELEGGLKTDKDEIYQTVFIIDLLAGIILFLICYAGIQPMKKLLRYLKRFGKADAMRPRFKHNNEYAHLMGAIEGATKEMLSQDRSRREFVSNVSHEMKTPLSSIKVLTESLLLQEGVPEDIYREFLQDINSEIDRMNNIVNDLLTLTRLDEGEKALNLSTYSIKDMLEAIVKRVEPLTREREITLELLECEDLSIEADETKLTLAISNLIQNAIKYNKDQGKVTVTCQKEENKARIVIEDTGIGIDEVHFEKLFDRFYRVDKARDRNSGGSGLGLSIVKKIISLHGGEIHVLSQVGEGSTFTVLLPLEQETEGFDV